MKRPAQFGDLAAAATRHLGAARPAGDMTPESWTPQASVSLAAISRTLAALVRDCAGAFDNDPATLAGAGSNEPGSGPGGWDTAIGPSWLALQRAQHGYQQAAAGRCEPGSRCPQTSVDELRASAAAIAGARDLLNSHFAPAPHGGGLQDNSEWAPAVRSVPVARAILLQVGQWSRQAASITVPAFAIDQVQPATRAAASLSLAAAIITETALWDRPAELEAGLRLLSAVPVNQRPAQVRPGPAASLTEVCQGSAVSAEHARYAARRTADHAQYSPLMSAAAVRETAVACTVVAHHCAIALDILSSTAAAPVHLTRAAAAGRETREAWLTAARALTPFSSDSPAALAPPGARSSPEAAHARDLAEWTGQIVYADPAWTIATPPPSRDNWRTAAELTAGPDGAAVVVGALHHAAYTLATLSAADRSQLTTAITAGRLLVQHNRLPAPQRYEPGPRTRAYRDQWARPNATATGCLLRAYDTTVISSQTLLAEITSAAEVLDAASAIVISARDAAAQAGTSSHWGAGPDPPRRMPVLTDRREARLDGRPLARMPEAALAPLHRPRSRGPGRPARTALSSEP